MTQDEYARDLCGAWIVDTGQGNYPPYSDCYPDENTITPTDAAKLHVYTIPCVQITFLSASLVTDYVDEPGWACGKPVDSGAATPNLSDVVAMPVSEDFGLWPLSNCSTLGGVSCPALPIPNLDALVGTTATFLIITNWCSFLALPGDTQSAPPNGVGDIACVVNTDTTTTTAAASSAGDRTLAATNPLQTKVKVQVKASAYDCHVPKVKGLTLRKANARLLSHHCGRPFVSYSKSGHGVRYQPLPVGAGRPKGYRVNLVVARRTRP
jgi:hypothetical protein